jgi:hypothetical protein
MSVVKQVVGTRNSLTTTGLGTLASTQYAFSNSYPANSGQPVDVIVEVDVAVGTTPTGNAQAVVFIQESLDGTVFRSGPTSNTDSTNEPDLKLLGVVPIKSITNVHIGTFSVLQALGYVPYAFKIVVKNDAGVIFTLGTIYTAEISNTVV